MSKIKQNSVFDNQGKGRFVKVNEIAELFSVSPNTVRNWVYLNKIPSIKFNGARRFDLEVLKKMAIGKE